MFVDLGVDFGDVGDVSGVIERPLEVALDDMGQRVYPFCQIRIDRDQRAVEQEGRGEPRG